MTDKKKLKLAFSGGGFRATFYCLGAYRRLIELGLHTAVSSISSVSGGSIAAGAIMMALSEGDFRNLNDFDLRVTEPLRKLGQMNFRGKMLVNAFLPSIANLGKVLKIELPRTRLSHIFPETLDEVLFHGKRMVELKKIPEWSCNATCLNTMKRFRFKTTDIYGNFLGSSTDISDITVAFAVAASAAFPMMFSPLCMDNRGRTYYDKFGSMAYSTPPETLYLTDGGVYDNLGSENILKDDTPYMVLDASASGSLWRNDYKPSYKGFASRILNTSLNQNVLLRRRLIFKQNNGIQLLLSHPISQILEVELEHRILKRCLPDYTSKYVDVEKLIGNLRTDLDAFHNIEIDLLMWSGAIKMDLGVKTLFSELISEGKWNEVPAFPEYPDKRIEKVLKLGQNRKYIGKLHQSLYY